MPTPSEHKTVQARILGYAEAIGWTFVPREEAEQRRGFDPEVPPADRAKTAHSSSTICSTPSCGNSIRATPRPRARWAFRHLHTDIYGNRSKLV